MADHDLPLLLVRHAVAEDSHVLGDEARALTPKGRAAFRLHARKLARLTPLMGILTSPLVRAVQTAELLAEALCLSHVEVHPALVPMKGAARHVLKLAREVGPGWALVGHNPSLERAAALALGQDLPDTLRKGCAVALRPQGRDFSLQWLASPGRPLRRP
ncbi:histidine phosphatase family protein [Corallococcus sp. ZKHCc1 1396]|uniref:Histidine phosphatase family protein n=1 Tax=Corallococcus soli TaxID=2710757 RepID=A0ABR9PZT7_9BACT|nr:phosphoglycerate mutase family protein [Corallococcus soli]MBE4753404.1 histidine phosphatase family protein [Corallococcus soli]